MTRVLAPSGSPVRFPEVAGWLAALVGRRDMSGALADAVRAAFDVRHCLLFSTGRAAMCFLFGCLRRLCGDDLRNEVVVPGYTCFSVASSVIMAGLKIRVCDIDPDTLSYDLEELRSVDFSRVLCVVTSSLYGLPDELDSIEQIAAENSVYLVDDAAQSLGATVAGRASGTFGIAGLYSLDKGKNITSMQGGMIVTNDDALAGIMLPAYSSLELNSIADNAREYIKVLIYYIFLNPLMYRVPASLPFLNLGETRYEDDYPLHKYPVRLAPLALAQMRRLREITGLRVRAAEWYQQSLPAHPQIFPIQPVPGSIPVWLRFPLRISENGKRERFLLLNRNRGCTGSYPASIPEIPEIRGHVVVHNGRCEQAAAVAREIVTLPTHAYVTRKDVDRILQSMKTIVSG